MCPVLIDDARSTCAETFSSTAPVVLALPLEKCINLIFWTFLLINSPSTF